MQEKLIDKRHALFGVALAALLALLTSAAGVQYKYSLQPSAHGLQESALCSGLLSAAAS
jgi:hypothetical protein